MNFATNPRILLHLPPPSEILGEREGVAGGKLPEPSGIIINSFARGLRNKMPTALRAAASRQMGAALGRGSPGARLPISAPGCPPPGSLPPRAPCSGCQGSQPLSRYEEQRAHFKRL